MADLKLCVWNVEWMNDLFGSNDLPPAFRPDSDKPAHASGSTVRKRRDDLSGVIDDLAPDVVVVVEGPNRSGELQLFFDEDVQGDWLCHIQNSKGQAQNLGLAVRTDQGKFNDPPFKAFDTNNLQQFGEFLVDTDDDEIEEIYHFERRPLYAEINPQNGRNFSILGLHLKSKGIFDAYEWSKWWAVADANRRKILAQATQIRLQFLDAFLRDPLTQNHPLLVCGDINDGPGMDASEKRLFGSGVERLMGSIWEPALCLGNSLYDSMSVADRENLNFEAVRTTRFKDPIFNDVTHSAWIDHILYSKNTPQPWVILGKVNERLPDDSLIWRKYKHASDHFPLTATISV